MYNTTNIPSIKTKAIHIVVCINDAYSQHCAATIASIFINNKNEVIKIHVITDYISKKNQSRLEKIAFNFNQQIQFYTFNNSTLNRWPCFKDGMPPHVTIQTYYRLFIPQILPLNIKKTFYLDCDLLVLHPLREFWNTKMQNKGVAAIADQWTDYIEAATRLKYRNDREYFNAGVLLLNLEYLRNHNFTNNAIDFVTKHANDIVYHDQDVLNKLIGENRIIMPVKWNVCSFKINDKIPHIYNATMNDARKDPYIIHFFAPIKPWNQDSSHPYRSYYYYFLQFTPWKHEVKCHYSLKNTIRTFLIKIGLRKSQYAIAPQSYMK
ncbi:glycosyltransferase family 8 protein [Bacteroides eggerthii]|uniref:Glucosyltransferase n=1 Tax=Bacteroides eggerthii TaxID=28111 RepID=A0A380YLU1_9BACE|nr:glycosyltransferase family 8 protein [Bacteroides eggerthii]EEC53420.1 general stress protein A [Bacteroides eggerthii DSM 20697]QRQ47364.1 glycosyltransferase family 8 protein [Bacteroides eggerthii]UWN87091.1 glycosyltransferase family 8 protein [Bacteroides eggerthii]SUV29507.1 glucosyltransferase [Bacteroides eggerthii]